MGQRGTIRTITTVTLLTSLGALGACGQGSSRESAAPSTPGSKQTSTTPSTSVAATSSSSTSSTSSTTTSSASPSSTAKRPPAPLSQVWNPAAGNCELLDKITEKVLAEKQAVTDYEVESDGCYRIAASNESKAVSLYSRTETAEQYIAQRKTQGPVSSSTVADGPTAQTLWVTRTTDGSTMSDVIWRGDDGRTWLLSYSGPDAHGAAKQRMLAAARTVDQYIVAGGASSATTTAQTPTFGVEQPPAGTTTVMAAGLGAVKPKEFALSTHSTTYVTDITWTSWGGQTARGTGKAKHALKGTSMADAPIETATIVATLGTCNGKPAYTKVNWSFPGEPEGKNEASWDLCDLDSGLQ